MMHNFLLQNRESLIERCRRKASSRVAHVITIEQLQNGIPLFLNQLIETLRIEQPSAPLANCETPEQSECELPASDLGRTVAKHGQELLRFGFSIDQLVHNYGDLCQAITDLAFERGVPFEIDEFRTLIRFLDDAIANTVVGYTTQRESISAHDTALEIAERLEDLAQDLRGQLGTAMLAFAAAKASDLSLKGATGSVLEHGLFDLRDLIDRALADSRSTAGTAPRGEVFSVAEFIEDLKFAAEQTAQVRRCPLLVTAVSPTLNTRGDRDLLYAAAGSLIQNAFKVTRAHTAVYLNVRTTADHILIDVVDHCGGLQDGDTEILFLPLKESAVDKTSLELGLHVARKNVELNGGSLTARNLPGKGCAFTISLPRFDGLSQGA
jgi:signal transduction histidine kinase